MRSVFKFYNPLFFILAFLIIYIGTYLRVSALPNISAGKDYRTHIEAVTDLLTGVNPYKHTLETYKNLKDDPGNKGYAYLPGIMYINSGIYLIASVINAYTTLSYIEPHVLMEIPGIIADVFICLFFIKVFFKKDNVAMLFSIILWMFNSLFLLKFIPFGYDSVAICLYLWALYFLEKDDVISSSLLSLGIIFKTFPLILLPIFILKSKDKLIFIMSGIVMYLFVSIPFLRSVEDFLTYVKGSLLVHGDRFIQGRPYLFYISYFYHVEFFRIIPFKIYSVLAIISGWLSGGILVKYIKDKYILSCIPFLTFYLFTPVLNRTYILWGIPIFLIGSYKLFENKNKILFYVLNVLYFVFTYWYLAQWKDGFQILFPS